MGLTVSDSRHGCFSLCSRRHPGLLAALALLWTLDGSTAAARSASPRAKTLLLLAAKNRSRVTSRAIRALRSQLSDTSLVLRVAWVNRMARSRAAQVALSKRYASTRGVLAVAWYDANQPNEILMLAASSGRLVVRRVTGATLSGRLEALAIIVRSSMLALLAGQPLPPQPRAPPPVPARASPARPAIPPRPRSTGPAIPPRPRSTGPAIPPRPRSTGPTIPPRPRSTGPAIPPRRPPPRAHPSPVRGKARRGEAGWRFGLGLEAGYFLSGYSSEVGAVSGGELAAIFHLRAGWELLLSYRVTQKLTGRVGSSRLDLQPHPIGLGARWHRRWGRFQLALALSVIMDWATLSTSVDPTTHRASSDGGDLLWSLLPTISAGVSLLGRLRLVLAVSAQVGLNWRRYVLVNQQVTEPLLSPWPVQPCLMIGFSADIV